MNNHGIYRGIRDARARHESMITDLRLFLGSVTGEKRQFSWMIPSYNLRYSTLLHGHTRFLAYEIIEDSVISAPRLFPRGEIT